MLKVDSIEDRLKRCTVALIANIALVVGLNASALAQSNLNQLSPGICDLDIAALKSDVIGKDRNIVTADSVSAQGTTVPSLWWTSEQFSAKLVTNWVANRSQKQIYLLVNAQHWNILDYIDRYRTVDKFGRVAQSYGYNLTICNNQKVTLADYACESISDPRIAANNCQIWLNANGQNGLGVQSK